MTETGLQLTSMRTIHRFHGILAILIWAGPATTDLHATTYHVKQIAEGASDSNPGTEKAPWKTISRAGVAEELRPGDNVLIHSGVYREHVELKVSGEPGKPITLTAAPGARVVVKGSELLRGKWTKLADEPDRKEPYPRAFAGVWKTELGEEFFTDPRFQGSYRHKSRRWVSQVFIDDNRPLQRIGPDPIYRNEEYLQLATVGRGLGDMIPNSFFFDPADQMLYIKISGKPAWFSIEVGVRGFALTAREVHDVVIRGLEFRHNRQPGGQWSMVSVSRCQRVVVEECKVYQSDFCGLSLYRCEGCAVRNYVTAKTITRGCDLTLWMGCPDYGPYKRTVTSNHADYNVYANTGWTPTMRHTWNPNNTLPQWQERFEEDVHSSQKPVAFSLKGTGFALKTRKGLGTPGPLPEAVQALLPHIPHAGCRRFEWPAGTGNQTEPEKDD